MKTLAVLGAGSMGTALAHLAAANGHTVHLWSIEADVLEEVRDHRRNTKYLPDLDLNPLIRPFWELAAALAAADIAIISVPSSVVRTVARDAAPHLGHETIVLNVAKGLEEGTHPSTLRQAQGSGQAPSTGSGQVLRMSQVIGQELREATGRIVSMGGPAIAAEVARATPTAVIVAAERLGPAAAVQAALQNEHFKVETSPDLVGVEMAASLKNAYAIALGMCDGLGLGTNTKSFIVTLALGEMAAIITALGGQLTTVYGLAGLGDLITTGFSPGSRNRTLGEKLCTDPNWRDFVRTHTVEGIAACRIARDLARHHDIRTPLLDSVYDVLFEDRPPPEAMRTFLRDFLYGER